MIRTEIIKSGNKEFFRTYSDSGMKIKRDGAIYDEAIDPIDKDRKYTETNIPILDEKDI